LVASNEKKPTCGKKGKKLRKKSRVERKRRGLGRPHCTIQEIKGGARHVWAVKRKTEVCNFRKRGIPDIRARPKSGQKKPPKERAIDEYVAEAHAFPF